MGRDFRIHTICLVKNEGDIIAHCLNVASKWSDRIIVYDNGSDDDTWDIVRGMASEKIIPWKQDGKVYQESLLAEAFNACRAGSKPGDWWCRLDADEFYIQDPRQFLANIPWPYHVVWGIAVEFYLTKQEVAQNELEPPGDINQQIERLRYYSINNSHPRFFRDRKGLRWPVDTGWPIHMGPVYPARLLYKHYKYRSPQQIQRRLNTRRDQVERGFPGWEHARDSDWRQKLADARLLKEANGQRYEYREEDLPRHLDPPAKRYLKMALHQLRIFP